VLGLVQLEPGSADNDFFAEINEVFEDLFQVQGLWSVVDHCEHVDAETGLQGGELVELIDDHICIDIFLEVNDDADTLQIRFIPQVADAFNLAFIHQSGDFFHQIGFIQGVGDLRDNDGFQTLFAFFHMDAGPDFYASSACPVGLANAGFAVQQPPRGEIRGFDQGHQIRDCCFRVVQEHKHCIHDFRKIVRWDIGGHAHGDSRRTVDKQVGHLGGQDDGFFQAVVIVGPEGHGVFFDVS